MFLRNVSEKRFGNLIFQFDSKIQFSDTADRDAWTNALRAAVPRPTHSSGIETLKG